MGCNFVSDKLFQKMSELKIVPNFNIENLCKKKDILKSHFGKFRLKKLIALKSISGSKHKALFSAGDFEIFNTIKTFDYLTNPNSCVNKTLKIKKPLFAKEALESLITLPAYYCFDLEQKGSFESGKKANFLVLNKDIMEVSDFSDVNVLSVYTDANLIFTQKKKNKG